MARALAGASIFLLPFFPLLFLFYPPLPSPLWGRVSSRRERERKGGGGGEEKGGFHYRLIAPRYSADRFRIPLPLPGTLEGSSEREGARASTFDAAACLDFIDEFFSRFGERSKGWVFD